MTQLSGHSIHWYLLQCKPLQQSRAEENLKNQEFDTYAPTLAVKRIRRGKYQTSEEALFPGYLFIRLGTQSNWRALQATRGVSRIVSFNGLPHPVPDDLIAGLQQRYSSTQQPEQLYKPGDKVTVTDGCFKHVEAIVKAVTPDERIIVLIKILQSQQSLVMDPVQLAKVS
jgi:transcriptional antiterminator RfaH